MVEGFGQHMVEPVPYRVLHIAYSGDGGAGRAGRRASDACKALGIHSAFASVIGADVTRGDIAFNLEAVQPGTLAGVLTHDVQWGVIPAARADASTSLFSIAYPGADIASLPAVAAADIIHLHWPTWTVTPPQISGFLAAGKKVFVTLHDMWMFTGGCHYASGCTQYRTACLKCPQVPDRLGLASASFDDKLANYGGNPDFHVITLCTWMKDMAGHSRILGNAPTHLIPNPIETDIFTPMSPETRRRLRADLGFGDSDLLLLFGAFDSAERRKGGGILQQAIQLLATLPQARIKGRIHLMSFGKNADFDLPPGMTYSELGNIADDALLAQIYGLADVLCFPSIEDNYPNSIVEAAGCGTPSIVFATGGMADMVEHGATGLQVAQIGDAAAFAAAIAAFATDHLGDQAMRARCRAVTEQRNGMAHIGGRLDAAYRQALGLPAGAAGMAEAATGVEAMSHAIQSRIRVRHHPQLGARFDRFPVSHFLRGKLAEAGAPKLAAPPATLRGNDNKIRLMTVRTYHEHHSCYSGPYQFLRHLGDQYDQTNIIVPLGNDLLPADVDAKDIKALGQSLGLSGYAHQGNAWVAEYEVAGLLQRKAYDIVHFIDGELGGWLATRLPGAVFAGRRPLFLNMLHQPAPILKNMISVPALRRFDVIGAVAEDQAQWLRNLVPEVPVIAVKHGVDIDFFCPGPARTEPGPFRLLAVGHWLRDYELAIKALNILWAEGLRFDYRIVSHNLNLTARPPYVTHLSGLTDEELRDEYRQADAVFMPLQDATANNALLEGMACGRPVISTDVGSVAEYVSPEAGFVCDATPQACADAVRALMGSAELCRAMGSAGRAHALDFAWAQVGRRFDQAYGTMLQGRGAA